MTGMFDMNELLKRAIKYLIEGLAVAICAMLIPKKALNVEEIIIIALTAAATPSPSAAPTALGYFIAAGFNITQVLAYGVTDLKRAT